MLHRDMIAADGDMEDCAYRSRNLAVSVGFRF